MNASFRVRITLNTNRLSRAFACSGVGLSALASDRESTKMPNSAITFNALQAFQIHAQFTSKVAFDDILAFLDGMDDLRQLLFVQALSSNAGINLSLFEDNFRVDWTNTINVSERNVDPLVAWNINT